MILLAEDGMELLTESGLTLDLASDLIFLSGLLPGTTITSLARLIRTPATVTLPGSTIAGLSRSVRTDSTASLWGATTTFLTVTRTSDADVLLASIEGVTLEPIFPALFEIEPALSPDAFDVPNPVLTLGSMTIANGQQE